MLFRHCPRTTSESVVPLENLSNDVYDYLDADPAEWDALGYNWCLSASEDILNNTGKWLVRHGIIKPGQKT